jgi:asparagine synthase (glutamine-hydrolysing)
MCAINGITAPNAIKRVAKMNSLTERRGPEGSSVWSNDRVTLGHNRLATMGRIENSTQPLHYINSSIVFNGAIFNWKEIDEWNSNVDTEVLLKGLHHYG